MYEYVVFYRENGAETWNRHDRTFPVQKDARNAMYDYIEGGNDAMVCLCIQLSEGEDHMSVPRFGMFMDRRAREICNTHMV